MDFLRPREHNNKVEKTDSEYYYDEPDYAGPSLLSQDGPIPSVELCYCSEGCDVDARTCRRQGSGACFRSAQRRYDEQVGGMTDQQVFGCLPPEGRGFRSPLQCHAHLASHHQPTTIACCYDGNHCNMNLTLPEYNTQLPNLDAKNYGEGLSGSSTVVLGSCGLVALMVVFLVLLGFWCRKRNRKQKSTENKKSWRLPTFLEKLEDPLLKSRYDMKEDLPAPGTPLALETRSGDEIELSVTDSGSGSGVPHLTDKTVGRKFELHEVVGQGRYGVVRRATRGGEQYAVKEFYTTEEASWKRERDIYQTPLISNKYVLGYLAADIISSGSVTRMVLITHYHEHGSLYDYLKRVTLDTKEALDLSMTMARGLCHVHDFIKGSLNKPSIAHRDIKSKNILVKAPGHVVIADFGLAIKHDPQSNELIGLEDNNRRVGTLRYMAPEVLDQTIKRNIESYQRADMYSYALVLWEITRRLDLGDGQGPVVPRLNLTQPPSPGDSGQLTQSSRSLPYQCPYEDLVPSDPSDLQMMELVCHQASRPPISPQWNDNHVTQFLAGLMHECWRPEPGARLTAYNVKSKLFSQFERLVGKDTQHLDEASQSVTPLSGSPTPRDQYQPDILPMSPESGIEHREHDMPPKYEHPAPQYYHMCAWAQFESFNPIPPRDAYYLNLLYNSAVQYANLYNPPTNPPPPVTPAPSIDNGAVPSPFDGFDQVDFPPLPPTIDTDEEPFVPIVPPPLPGQTPSPAGLDELANAFGGLPLPGDANYQAPETVTQIAVPLENLVELETPSAVQPPTLPPGIEDPFAAIATRAPGTFRFKRSWILA